MESPSTSYPTTPCAYYSVPQEAERNGHFLPADTPPPPRQDPPIDDWSPFENRPTFEYAELVFEKTMFNDVGEVLATIDEIPHGDLTWSSFNISYNGQIDADSPSWMHETYTIHTRDTLAVQRQLISNWDFVNGFDYVPFRTYKPDGTRTWSNLMSGHWAWKQADKVAEDPLTHGAMLCPIILGSDKTTVSVATGNSEFHPVYMSSGNLRNEMRRGHCDAVVPIAFLSIPKTCREHERQDDFRMFRRQLYHASLVHILQPLREGMTVPQVVLCPDGHYRRAIFELGPFIADYPEQVLLAGIVQGWCPKCLASNKTLDNIGPPRFRALTEELCGIHTEQQLWDAFGIVGPIKPFITEFPRADIHELISPDILHQLIKGTFKDHIVSWVEGYIKAAHPPAEAQWIMDDIDRREAFFIDGLFLC
ncbi:hypothetical protein NLI96_g6598 [Meripilus lineatus]|uniref:Uncharacterized protein n=1 Tax=Meripilus lineatus TaxID=2056292 RepID=A0AAD5V1A8_9APHY|nr:hypothetical protein NLI96_g6598 [Physisporinus lineatus]